MAALDKQKEEYVQGLYEGFSQRQAYLRAFPQSHRWKDGTVDSKACILAKSEKIQERLTEIKEENASNTQMTRAAMLKWLYEIMHTKNIAVKGSYAVKAAELYIRMCGYDEPDPEPTDTEAVKISKETLATLHAPLWLFWLWKNLRGFRGVRRLLLQTGAGGFYQLKFHTSWKEPKKQLSKTCVTYSPSASAVISATTAP
jgi:hypothetical protein